MYERCNDQRAQEHLIALIKEIDFMEYGIKE